MLEDTATTGSIKTTKEEKRLFSKKSHAYNLANPKFQSVFPEYCTAELQPLPNMPGVKDTTTTTTSESSSVSTNITSKAGSEVKQRRGAAQYTATAVGGSGAAVAGANGADATTLATSSTTQQDKPHGLGVGNVKAVGVADFVWQSVRSNIWLLLLLGVFGYLITLKVMSKIGGAA
ncbi:Ubiquitin-conjugating enzyme E2 6 [Blyttiomyces sp. JEL0837]|nr:Ubiquitin-conjugating enzyme E2 6 [Blyttiomyces sp. JEL0837]